jgi:tetratricopeptide (TPR) repeat protein
MALFSAQPDNLADTDSAELAASSGPLFASKPGGNLEATMEVAPVLPEPTVELPAVEEQPKLPSTPWADLITASTPNTVSETESELDEDEGDQSAPLPDFISAAPSRAELPDFSDDMPDFGAAFGNFGTAMPDFSSPASDFGTVADGTGFTAASQPVEADDFAMPASATPEAPDVDAVVPGETPNLISSTPDTFTFPAGLVATASDFSAPTGVPDFSAPPTPAMEVPDFSAPSAPAMEMPDFSAPTPPVSGLPDFSVPTLPASGMPDFLASPPPATETPGLSSPDQGPTPSAELPDFSPTVPAAVSPEPPTAVPASFEQPPVPVAPLTSAHPAIAMGGQAEEILEDDFQFSPEAGPSRPQWKGWGVSERESVQQICESAVGSTLGKIPAAFSGPVFQALRSDVNKFQIVLGPGCGKTHLAHDLCSIEPQGSFGPALLAEWPANHNGEVDGQELLSVYFQLREDSKARGTQAVMPEPETVATLAAAVATDGFASSFQRLIGQLAVLNRGGLTLLFDEPPEGIRQNLPATLPGKVRLVSLVTAMNSGPELGARVELQAAWPQAAVELFGPVVSEVTSDPAANLLRVGLYVQLRTVGDAPPSSLADIGKAVLASRAIDPDLLACLALERDPVSLDDLDQWYLDSNSVAACVESFPSLFCLRSSRLSPQLGLSHHSIETAVIAQLQDAYQKAANKLLGWVTSQLERTNADKYGGLQVREIVFRNFCRLYHNGTVTGSKDILEWVARNKDLQRNRVALSTHLEKPANRWELHKLLLLLADSLRTLVDTGSCNDLRDELAWALSHMGLNQFHLGLSGEARENVIEAMELFTTLVDKEKQHEFRPALATTLYRASKIADAMGLGQEAREHAERAVSDLVELVEDRGRADLQSRLGISMALRGSLKNDAGDVAGAMKDLQRASSLLASSSEDKKRENKSSQVEVQLELASIFLKARDIDNAIKESGKAVQLATQAVEELQMEDLQPLLASCHTSRARCFLELNEADRAQRDVSKSITLRNLVVDEGRLEQRFELSTEYLLRAQIDRGRGMVDDAGRDMTRAVEILEQLDSEGRKDAKRQLLICLVERSELALVGGDATRSIEDLKKAFAVSQADTSGTPESALARLSVLDGLLRAYLRAGDSDQALGVSTELLTHYQAIGDWENFARVQVVRGDALERQANLVGANESFTQAVTLLSKLLEQGQTDERLAMVAEAYLGAGSVELKLGNSDRAAEQIKRSLDIFSHLFQQRGMKAALPKMLKAYSLFAAVNLNKGKTADAMVLLKSGFDILGYLEKEGGAANLEGIELRKAELYRQRARALFAQAEVTNALHDTDEAMRNFLLDRQKNQTGPWKDELARTWTLRSSIFFVLKDFTQAESSIQEAITHFEEQVRAGKFQYFDDLMKALSTRAENAGKAGKIDRVLEEYGRMLAFATAAGQAGTALNVDLESAKILEKRARVYREQGLFNEAYGDYEKVIVLYRKMVSERGRGDLAIDLVRIHLERGEMISGAGHAEHAVGDYSQAVDLAKALVGQGHIEAAASLARALHKRADCYKAAGKAREALQDLEGAVGFQMQMAQQRQDPELLGNLARALLSQGSLLAGFQQFPQAAASLDSAIGIFTTLVEQQQQRQYSADMAQALIQRVSLTGDKTDPALRQVLIRAVDLVTTQAREGKPVARDFPIDCLRAVVDLLTREDFDTVGDLIDAVLRLVELVVADGKSSQDFVKLTDLLLAASAGLIDDRRTARRPHFLALACVSCNREIQMFGKNSLPRLVYCLYELGQALERSKPPTVLNYIGSSFALLGELASQQQNNEDFTRELKMMVTTWRSLPPQVPALANVSRHMLSQLLRLT